MNRMLFHQISNFTRFTIESEPNSLFYKEGNNFDGSINAYKIKDFRNDEMLKPVTFPRDYKVQISKVS
jgi:hypothetical protein